MTTAEDSITLMSQIAQFAPIPVDIIERVGLEASRRTIDWVAEYGEYQSGGWWTVSLFNNTGDPRDVIIKDCQPIATTLLQHMPHTRELLDSLGLKYMWVRLARLESNSFLWEHRDYGELSSAKRSRLHIPLATNKSAYLVINGFKVHMRQGGIWRLNPTFQHGVCNLCGPDRIHLIIDCYANDQFTHLTANAKLLGTDYETLPSLSAFDLEKQLSYARNLMSLGYIKAAESQLLRLFYQYTLPSGFCYDLIADLHQSMDFSDTAQLWQMKKDRLLGDAR